jgi:hypothetical protein
MPTLKNATKPIKTPFFSGLSSILQCRYQIEFLKLTKYE